MQNFAYRENVGQTWTDIMKLKPSQKCHVGGICHQRRKPVQRSMLKKGERSKWDEKVKKYYSISVRTEGLVALEVKCPSAFCSISLLISSCSKFSGKSLILV